MFQNKKSKELLTSEFILKWWKRTHINCPPVQECGGIYNLSDYCGVCINEILSISGSNWRYYKIFSPICKKLSERDVEFEEDNEEIKKNNLFLKKYFRRLTFNSNIK